MYGPGSPPMPSTPQPPAFDTAATNSGPAMPPPIPTEKIGYSIPSCRQSGVFNIAPPEKDLQAVSLTGGSRNQLGEFAAASSIGLGVSLLVTFANTASSIGRIRARRLA